MKLPHDSLSGTISAGVILTSILYIIAFKLINGI